MCYFEGMYQDEEIDELEIAVNNAIQILKSWGRDIPNVIEDAEMMKLLAEVENYLDLSKIPI